MNLGSRSFDDSLPLDVHEKIGELRERFEDACQGGQAPVIEEFLPEIEEVYREALFRELLGLELDYAAVQGQTPEADGYLARFPQYTKTIEEVFQETRMLELARERKALPDDLRFGPYVANRELGRGGFGVVYLATHDETGHQVAIKVGAQSLHEAKTLLSLKHPSIIRVLHVGRDAHDQTFLVMDYMDGGSLRDRMDAHSPMLPEEAISIASRIAEALHAAHTHPQQIYHRDLKPENVLFDADGNVCVADFGLALTEAQQETHRGDFSGTPPYQSPEQIRGEVDWIDARSDVWALGVILYEMLTGRLPFSGRDLREQIQQKSPKSPSQINESIPEVLESICLKCLEKDPTHRYQTANALARALRGQELGVNPYKGLESFEEADADRFFGRQDQIQRLRDEFVRLYEASLSDHTQPRIVPILGPSGCGKSSLAKAGLVPVLRKEHLPDRSEVRVAILRPRMRPLKSLADVLDTFAGGSEEAGVSRSRKYVRDLQNANEKGEYDGLWWIADSLPDISNAPLVVVIDQFEEIFTECEDEAERTQFVENLLYAASQKDGAFSVVFTLRSDFLAETQQHEALNAIIADVGILIPAMKENDLREAIATPARNAGYELDEAIVNLLVKDSNNREGALPLLQVVLTRIWDGLRQGTNPAETYRRLGGIGGALAKAADAVFDQLSEEEQHIARRIFLGLVKLGEGTQDTRRTAEVDQILSYKDAPQLARKVLTKFSAKDTRFITLKRVRSVLAAAPYVALAELTHEALLEHWQRLRNWLDASRSDLRFRERLDDAARRWDELGRPTGSLWRPPELDVLRQRRSRLDDDLNILQKEFSDAAERYDQELIEAQQRQQQQEEQQRQREVERQHKELRRLRAAAAVFLFLVAGLAASLYWAFVKKSEADALAISEGKARAQAQASAEEQARQRQRAEDAQADAEKAAAAEIEQRKNAQRAYWSTSVNQAQQLCEEGDVAQGLLLFQQALRTAEAIDDPGLEKVCRLNLVAWARELHTLKHILSHPSRVNDLMFSSNGEILATACNDNTVRLWRVNEGTFAGDPLQHPGAVASLAFHPYDDLLVTGCTDGKVRVWRPRDGNWAAQAEIEHHAADKKLEPTFRQHKSGISSIDFSPDGSRFATGGYDGIAKVWSTATLDLVCEPFEHSHWITDVTFCAHGDCLAAVGVEWRIKVWDIKSGELIQSADTDGRMCYAIDADCTSNRLLAATLQANGAIQWSFATNSQQKCVLRRLRRTALGEGQVLKHFGWVKDATYSADGSFIATACDDHLARVWDSDSNVMVGPPLRNSSSVTSICFAPDSATLAAGCSDGTVRVWRLASKNHFRSFRHEALFVSAVAFGASEETLLVAGADGRNKPRIWDIGTGEQIFGDQLKSYFYVGGAALSPDERTLYIAHGKTVEWLDVHSGNTLKSANGHSGRITKLAATPECRRFVTGSGGQAVVWDSITKKVVCEVRHRGHARALSIDSTGNRLLTAADDTHVQLWDATTGDPLGEPIEVGTKASAIAFAPDDRHVLIGGVDGTVRLWDTDRWCAVGATMNHLGEVTDAAFSPDQSLAITCSLDQTARIWDPLSGKVIGPLLRHDDVVRSVSCSRGGRYLVTGGKDRLAKLWHMPSPAPGDAAAVEQVLKSLTGLAMDESGALSVLQDIDALTLNDSSPTWDIGEFDVSKWHRERARECVAAERWEKVIVHLNQVVAHQEGDPRVRYSRGLAHLSLQQYDQAIDDFDIAATLDSELPDVYHQRAHAYANAGQNSLAARDLLRALEREPNSQHFHEFAASCYARVGNYARALHHYREYVTLRDGVTAPTAALLRKDASTAIYWGRRSLTAHPADADQMLEFARQRLFEISEATSTEHYNLACVYSLLLEGSRNSDDSGHEDANLCDQSLEYLSKAMELGFDDFGLASTDRDLRAVRQTSRYRGFLAEHPRLLVEQLFAELTDRDEVIAAIDSDNELSDDAKKIARELVDQRVGTPYQDLLSTAYRALISSSSTMAEYERCQNILERLRNSDPMLMFLEAMVKCRLEASDANEAVARALNSTGGLPTRHQAELLLFSAMLHLRKDDFKAAHEEFTKAKAIIGAGSSTSTHPLLQEVKALLGRHETSTEAETTTPNE